LTPGQLHLPVMIDLGKTAEHRGEAPAPPLMQALISPDLEKRPGSEEPAPVLPPGQPRAQLRIDYSKKAERERTEPPLMHDPAGTTGMTEAASKSASKPKAPGAVVKRTWLAAGLAGMVAGGLLVTVLVFLRGGTGTVQDAGRATPQAGDEPGTKKLSPAEQKLADLWKQYCDRLSVLVPGSSPKDPWWKIAAEAHLANDKSAMLRHMQNDVLGVFDLLEQSVGDVSDPSLLRIIAAKDQLQAGQNRLPAPVNLEPIPYPAPATEVPARKTPPP
jgi:hypothetical protein